jgi:hypothetical protein
MHLHQDPKYKAIVKKKFNDSHQNKNMSKRKKFRTMPILVEWRTKNIKKGNKKSQKFKNYSCSTSSSNFALSSIINVDFASHALARLEGLKHPTLGLEGQFLFFVKVVSL